MLRQQDRTQSETTARQIAHELETVALKQQVQKLLEDQRVTLNLNHLTNGSEQGQRNRPTERPNVQVADLPMPSQFFSTDYWHDAGGRPQDRFRSPAAVPPPPPRPMPPPIMSPLMHPTSQPNHASTGYADHGNMPNPVSALNVDFGSTNTMVNSTAPTTFGDCPAFTPSTYQNWRREVRLWAESPPTATTSQLLARVIAALHQPSKLAGMAYMERTGTNPQSRTMQALIDILDERYGKTDYERSYDWLTQFTEFARSANGNLKDFRARYYAQPRD